VKRKKNQSGHSLSPYIDVMTGTVGLIVDQKSGGCKSGGNYNMFFQKMKNIGTSSLNQKKSRSGVEASFQVTRTM
jgi:hypothetical protein